MSAPTNLNFEKFGTEAGKPASWSFSSSSLAVSALLGRRHWESGDAALRWIDTTDWFVSDLRLLLPAGAVDLTIKWVPLFDSNMASATVNVWWLDDDNRLFFRHTDENLVLCLHGENVFERPVTFSASQVMRTRVVYGPAGAVLSHTGSTTGAGEWKESTGNPLSFASTAKLYLNGTNAGFNADAFDVEGVWFAGSYNAADAFLAGWCDAFLADLSSSLEHDEALYGSTILAQALNSERFEATQGWDLTYATQLSTTISAVYDSGGPGHQAFEDYEDAWDGTTSAMSFNAMLGSIVVGDFHPGVGTSETFEAGASQGWHTGFKTVFGGGDTVAASYDGGGTPEAFEDFEEVKIRIRVVVSDVTAALDTFETVDGNAHGLSANETITFETEGTLPHGVQAGVSYKVNTTPTASSFSIKDPGGNVIVLTDYQAGALYVVPDQTRFWTHELD